VWDDLHLPQSIPVFPEARRILAEFGNLHFGNQNDFVIFSPSEADEVLEEIKLYSKITGRQFHPVGVMQHQDRHYILVDEMSIVYTLIDELEPLASSFERAVEFLIWRHTSRHEMEADLESIGMRGKIWRLQS
jgi:hypothetical protein